MKIAEEKNCRIIFVGDSRQHSGVEAGNFFRILENHSTIQKVELREIHRQQEAIYKDGIMKISQGRVEEAFKIFTEKGWIKEAKGRYLDNAVKDYMRFTGGGERPEDCLLVSVTHRESDMITENLRKRLKGKGIISDQGDSVESFRSFNWTDEQKEEIKNYKEGMTVCFNTRIEGLAEAGETSTIKSTDKHFITLGNGTVFDPRKYSEKIELGEERKLELCVGDIIQFTVNDKKQGIINGQRGRFLGDNQI